MRYMLENGVARFCLADLHIAATQLLNGFEVELTKMRDGLIKLPELTEQAELFVGHATHWQPHGGRPLHQWHAQGDLPWLLKHNAVGAYEALVKAGALTGLKDLCSWVGSLNAKLRAAISRASGIYQLS